MNVLNVKKNFEINKFSNSINLSIKEKDSKLMMMNFIKIIMRLKMN